ncbi:hypothetical protein H0H92_007671 [Tricholoma furcatifolium]|nr:hypothetical protein H0H92_007671 [Tricholoma furcatifolium]
MPSLAGLFGRKNKASSKQPIAETDSTLSSPTAEYVTADKSLPSSPNGRSLRPEAAYNSVYPSLGHPNGPSNSSKLRLFSRKKQSAAASTTSVVSTGQDSVFSTPPRPSFLTPRNSTSDSEADHRRLRPPPSKSAIFAAYADPQKSLSTRSLPNEPSRPVLGSDAPLVPPKKPGFFNWSKSAPKAPSPPSPTDSSFNLKSFRHVGPSSPLPSPALSPSHSNLSPASAGLTTPIPRPRGTSTTSNSDSSQRISVAAFREAQARRSTAGSPVPSLRSPSPAPGHTPLYAGARPSASHTLSASAVSRRRTSGLAYGESEEDESEEVDDDDDDEGEATIRARGQLAPIQNPGIGRRKRTLTKKRPLSPTGGRATKSEIGHGTRDREITSGPRAQSTHILMSQYPGPSGKDEQDDRVYDRAHSSLGFNNSTQRPRASASASAITPSAAAKRASVLAATKNITTTHTNNSASAPVKRHSRATSDHSIPILTPTSPETSAYPSPRPMQLNQPRRRATSASSSSSSEDDAPLATLVPPRRPGSSLSTASNTSNPQLRQKPLIDINELTKGRSARPLPSDEGFTGGRTLLGGRMTSSPPSISIPLDSPSGLGLGGPAKSPVQVSMSPPTRFVSPPASPKMKTDVIEAGTMVTILAEKDRNGLGERLNRVVQLRTGSTGVGVGTSFGSSGSSSGTSGSGSGTGLGLTMSPTVPKPLHSSTMPVPATSVSAPTTPSKVRAGTVGTSTTMAATANRTSPPAIKPVQPSPPEEDLAAMLGAGVHLIRRTGDTESDEEEEEAEESSSEDEDEKREREKPITPIPIRQRAPPPAFSVTSRPPLKTPSTASMAMSTTSAGGDSVSVSGSVSTSGASSGVRNQRQRSSTLVPPSSKPVGILNMPGKPMDRERERTNPPPPTTRQRSSTLLPGSVSASSLSPIPSTSTTTSSSTSRSSIGAPGSGSGSGSAGLAGNRRSGIPNLTAMVAVPPNRPFASGRRESPAGSSTGDSSSGRVPVTPRDGSDVGAASASASASSSSGLGVGSRHIKRRSVSFEDDLKDLQPVGKGGRGAERGRASTAGGAGAGVGGTAAQVTSEHGEAKRKERRRSEAKAAIELGNVINGRGPLVSDDEDDLPINQTMANAQARMSTLNPMMGGFGAGMPGWNMNMNMNMGMGMGMLPNPGMLPAAQFMPQPPQPGADAAFLAAHQQAMMYAKQAYQMAVAQQAMAAAGDEWERGSAYGGTASVYGGRSPSVVGSPFAMSPMMGMNGMNMGMGMNPMGMGMGMQGNGWSTGSVIFPPPTGSVYGGGGISGTRSEYGGGGAGGQWSSSKSSYGDYGSSNRNSRMMGGRGGGQRDSMQLPPMPPMPQQKGNSASGSGQTPRARTASQPANPTRGVRKAPPPSSWKASGV